MATLTNGTQQVTVPDDVVDSYLSRGWVRPGTPAPAEPEQNPLDAMTVPELKTYAGAQGIDLGPATLKADIRAAIEAAETE